MARIALACSFIAASMFAVAPAHACGGFFVPPKPKPGAAAAALASDASMVALMRDGTKTVVSMSMNYQGPPEDFALVVPVPVVLQKEQVKVLSPELFTRLDRFSAPRLDEFWEQDPCAKRGDGIGLGSMGG